MSAEPRVSDLLRAAFDVPDGPIDCRDPDGQTGGIYVERHGVATRGTRPAWLDWPSHTAAEMAREPWRPSVPRETKRQLA